MHVRVQSARAILVGAGAVALLTVVAFQLRFNLAATSSLYLLTVVLASLTSSFVEAATTSLLALLCLNYFFVPPVFTLQVTDPANWVALATFEAAALIVSGLSTHARKQARLAVAHRQNAEQLYELSRRIHLMDPRQPAAPQVVRLVMEVIQPESVALFNGIDARGGGAGAAASEMEDLARSAYLEDRDRYATDTHTWQRVLRMGAKSIGALALRGSGLDSYVADATASLAAIAIERSRSFDEQMRAESARETEQLRTTVLDSLAHAFKTPLTAIRTASSGLLEAGALRPSEADMVALIDEESERLSELATRLLRTARLSSDDIRLRPGSVDIAEAVRRTVAAQAGPLAGHPVKVSAESSEIIGYGDREVLELALEQLLDNAAKYSIPNSPISITIEKREAEVVVSVSNQGAAIRPEERERIFERYYRSADSKHRASGTGLGLSIAKKAAEAQRGRMWAASGNGVTTFFLAVPVAAGVRDDHVTGKSVGGR